MKSLIPSKPVTALAIMALCSQIAPVLAQDATSPPANPGAAATASPSETRPVQLSSGVAEILKLERARLSDEVITAFIRNSGKIYSLSASEILYLREQGVSAPVVTAMLDQRQNAAATAAQAAPQPVPTAPTSTQPASTYVAATPVYVAPSPVYVYSSPSYGYYDYGYYNYWPYYGGYWGYPGWSFSLGFGGGYYGGYRGGGYHGGYPRGGHGGGGHPGGHFGGGSPGGGHSGGGGHR